MRCGWPLQSQQERRVYMRISFPACRSYLGAVTSTEHETNLLTYPLGRSVDLEAVSDSDKREGYCCITSSMDGMIVAVHVEFVVPDHSVRAPRSASRRGLTMLKNISAASPRFLALNAALKAGRWPSRSVSASTPSQSNINACGSSC